MSFSLASPPRTACLFPSHRVFALRALIRNETGLRARMRARARAREESRLGSARLGFGLLTWDLEPQPLQQRPHRKPACYDPTPDSGPHKMLFYVSILAFATLLLMCTSFNNQLINSHSFSDFLPQCCTVTALTSQFLSVCVQLFPTPPGRTMHRFRLSQTKLLLE